MIPEDAPLRVCQETIYRYIYSKEGQREDLWWYLPTHRVARRPRRTRRRREPKFHRDVSILFRPDDVAHRRQLTPYFNQKKAAVWPPFSCQNLLEEESLIPRIRRRG